MNAPLSAHHAAPAHPAYAIDHLEPPFWWVGMRDSQLQLMVHGRGIGNLDPGLDSTGARIVQVRRVANPNYLFIDLAIDPAATPETMVLRFAKDGQSVLEHRYELCGRAADSAQRRGFDSADAIYLVLPDRFSNGAGTQTHWPATGEKVNRGDKAARHGGDLKGLRDNLSYIAGLGFTMLWLTPALENSQPGSYHGYAITDFYRIDPHFGDNEQYRLLVEEAKRLGIGVMQDVVQNHIGAGHWWMQDIPAPDWLNDPARRYTLNHAHCTVMDPHVAPPDRAAFTDAWFSDAMPDLDHSNEQLTNYLIQNTLWWIEYAGLSGLRMDAFSHCERSFLSAWSRRILEEYPDMTMVGEEWTVNPAIVSYYQRGKRNQDGYACSMPGMMDYPVYESVRGAFNRFGTTNGPLRLVYNFLRQTFGEQSHSIDGLTRLYETLADDFQYADPNKLVVFAGNHDTSRLFSALGNDIAAWKMAITYVATVRGIPQLLYGDELLMGGALGLSRTWSARADFPGGWAGDAVDAISGKGLSARQKESQAFVRRLFNWRRTNSAVHQGKMVHYLPAHGRYVYFRDDGANLVMVAFNLKKRAGQLDMAQFADMLAPGMRGVDVMSGQSVELGPTLPLAARSVTIVEFKR